VDEHLVQCVVEHPEESSLGLDSEFLEDALPL
jgi:hypothetical protein